MECGGTVEDVMDEVSESLPEIVVDERYELGGATGPGFYNNSATIETCGNVACRRDRFA